MAELLSPQVTKKSSLSPFVGAHVLESITAGMYDNPLMAYREYVQNSSDAIDQAIAEGRLEPDQGRIDIQIDGEKRCITIEDNGTGVSSQEAFDLLGDLGASPKDGTSERGFRGIGRLGGLGYCECIRFETRRLGMNR